MPADTISWQLPVSVPPLGLTSLHVWRYRLDLDQLAPTNPATLLSSDENERASRFHFPIHRNRYIAGRAMLRRILAAYQNTPPDSLTFSYAKYGKPSLPQTSGQNPVTFNSSHSQDLGVLVVGIGRTLGIDVEAVRADFGGEEVAELNFAPAEFHSLRNLPVDIRPQAFFNCWTRKEAYIKALGAGLQIPLDCFEVSLLPDEPAEFRRGVEEKWRLLSFSAEAAFQGALVYDGAQTMPEFYDASSLQALSA